MLLMTASSEQSVEPSGLKPGMLIAGGALFLAMIFSPAPAGLTETSWRVAALAGLMALWWLTEAMPLAITALLPLLVLPWFDKTLVANAVASYFHPLIFLFLGGFVVAKALEAWGLHTRMARAILARAPATPAGQVGAIMASTAFLSMWISNTATAMLMTPIAQAMLRGASEQRQAETSAPSPDTGFAAALMLGVAFSATIGGMATLVGTPPNALLAAYLESRYGMQIGFFQWMLLGLPIVLCLLPATWFLLTHVLFAVNQARISVGASVSEPAEIPETALAPGARLTAVIALVIAATLLLRPLVQKLLPWLPLNDAWIVLAGAILLLVIPAPGGKKARLLDLKDALAIRWDVLVLFGGGLALANAIETSGLSKSVSVFGGLLHAIPLALSILLAMAAVVYLGELASNTAMAAVFLPIAGAAAAGLGVAPLQFVVPIGLAASLGFMLPVATPPNAIAYGTGDVSARQMLKAGAILDVVSISIVFGLSQLLAPAIF